MNTVISNSMDIVSGRPHSKVEVEKFNEVITSLDLFDVWRGFYPEEKEYTWSRQNPFIARRLDYCFASENFLQMCASCEILSVPFTDHRAVSLDVCSSSFVRGPGYWRFNNSLLKEQAFIDKMNNLLETKEATGDVCKH